jgi:hypothetical protein
VRGELKKELPEVDRLLEEVWLRALEGPARETSTELKP